MPIILLMTQPTQSQRKMKVLIAEDELTSLKVLESILEPMSESDFALDGDEAYQKFRLAFEAGEKFDLICLDIDMPRHDGIECLEKIRKFEEQHGIVGEEAVKVLMVTGDISPNSMCDAIGEGCTAYIPKPLNRKRFVEELERLGVFSSSKDPTLSH